MSSPFVHLQFVFSLSLSLCPTGRERFPPFSPSSSYDMVHFHSQEKQMMHTLCFTLSSRLCWCGAHSDNSSAHERRERERVFCISSWRLYPVVIFTHIHKVHSSRADEREWLECFLIVATPMAVERERERESLERSQICRMCERLKRREK